jgi:hypothetical protein
MSAELSCRLVVMHAVLADIIVEDNFQLSTQKHSNKRHVLPMLTPEGGFEYRISYLILLAKG